MKSELIQEEWRPVRGYESLYDASNFGRIRSLDHWRDNGTGGYMHKGRILNSVMTKKVICEFNYVKTESKNGFLYTGSFMKHLME